MVKKQRFNVLSHFPNVAFNIVTLATSIGGLKAIREILSELPADFPAAITVLQHHNPQYRSHMVELLSPHTALKVKWAEEGEVLRPRTVYIAVSNKHLLVNLNGTLSLSDAPRVNFVRPSADKLFASVAASYKGRAIAVVLTGRCSDGLFGVLAIKKHGGIAIAQDKATSECFGMPEAAINTGKVDFVLPLNAIASTLINLITTEKVA